MSISDNLQGLDSTEFARNTIGLTQKLNAWLRAFRYGLASVTLTANQATTVVSDTKTRAGSFIGLMPRTANAAAEIGNGTMYISARTAGVSFTITHANNVQTDRDFTYYLVG